MFRAENAVYYRAEVVGRSDDFERYQVKFQTEEAPLQVSHSDILMFPQLEMEITSVCTFCSTPDLEVAI